MEEESLVIQDYIDALVKRWWLLLLVPALTGVVALGVTLASPSATVPASGYEATAIVFMDGAEALARFPDLVKTRPVLEGALEDLSVSMSIDELRGKVSAEPISNIPLLRVRSVDPDPELALAMADSVARSLTAHLAHLNEQQLTALSRNLSGQRLNPGSSSSSDLAGRLDLTLAEMPRRPVVIASAEIQKTPADVSAINTLGDRLARNVTVGLFLGGILAVMAVVGLEHVQNPIRSPEQLEAKFGLNRLGVLPRWPVSKSTPYQVVGDNSVGPVAAESVAQIANDVWLACEAQGVQTLAITSANSGDGRSSLVANLGVMLAEAWKEVVLVDADLHRPALHRYFGLDNEVGLSDFLSNNTLDVSHILQEISYPRLKVITGGGPVPRPAGLLASPRMEWLLEHLRETGYLVLLDTSPVLATTDAVLVASEAQGMVLVLNSEDGRVEEIKRALAKLAKTNTPLLGYVWNGMSLRRFGSYSSSQRYFGQLGKDSVRAVDPGPALESTDIRPHSNGARVGRPVK